MSIGSQVYTEILDCLVTGLGVIMYAIGHNLDTLAQVQAKKMILKCNTTK